MTYHHFLTLCTKNCYWIIIYFLIATFCCKYGKKLSMKSLQNLVKVMRKRFIFHYFSIINVISIKFFPFRSTIVAIFHRVLWCGPQDHQTGPLWLPSFVLRQPEAPWTSSQPLSTCIPLNQKKFRNCTL
jgi:hypothetical protein